MTFYGPVYGPDGEQLHVLEDCYGIFYWNDACWHRSVPEDSKGLTYLDVGFHTGFNLLRFEQRGGIAVGLDFHGLGEIQAGAEGWNVGDEFSGDTAKRIRSLYNGAYSMRVGGFDNGAIVPPSVGKFSIVSALNVIEYMDDPLACVRSLFNHATDRVLIATDTAPETVYPSNIPPLKVKLSRKDLVAACPWPCVVWEYDGGTTKQAQIFVCATREGSSLPPVDPSDLRWDMSKTNTQKFWEFKK